MAEVMARRYGIETKWPRPDLIVLDGGKGQLDAALPVIEAVELIHRSLALPSVWKKSMWKGRRIRLSLIRMSRRCSSCNLFVMKPIVLLSLIIESGRQRNTESILDHIAGIGPQRRNALWHAFRSLDEMRNATVEELTRVKGMNKTAAENVFRFSG